MWSKLVRFAFAAVMSVAFGVQLSAQGATQAPATPTKVVEQVVTETATVQAIDVAKREVTLKGPLGDIETVTVSDEVKRLDEIKVGDKVTAKYYIGIAAELRAPTAEEKAEPFKVIDGAGRTPAGSTPGAAAVRAVRVVATIEGLDRPTQTVTLKGPGGRYFKVRVADPKILEKPHLGDTVVVTAAEALAISIERVK
jgi:Cu/Ag efflux protein CusF